MRRVVSPAVTGFAAEILGRDSDDPLAAQWLIRVFLGLWCWPVNDAATQRAMLQRFLGPLFGTGNGRADPAPRS